MNGLVKIGVVAEYLGVKPPTVIRMMKMGQIPYYWLNGRCIRFRLSDVDQVLRRLNDIRFGYDLGQEQPVYEPYITMKQLSDQLSLSPTRIIYLIYSSIFLPCYCIGQRRRFKLSEVKKRLKETGIDPVKYRG